MAVPIPKLTPEDYLAIERKAEYRSEYYGGEMFAMPGGTSNHSLLAARIIAFLIYQLAGKGCRVYTPDIKVRTHPSGLYTYPDVTLVCGKPTFADDQSDVLTNPKVIVEVLSPSTEAKDRGFKFRQYKTIASLQEYVLISQSEALIESYGRQPGGSWQVYPESQGLDSTFTFRSLGLDIPLTEVYQDVDFES